MILSLPLLQSFNLICFRSYKHFYKRVTFYFLNAAIGVQQNITHRLCYSDNLPLWNTHKKWQCNVWMSSISSARLWWRYDSSTIPTHINPIILVLTLTRIFPSLLSQIMNLPNIAHLYYKSVQRYIGNNLSWYFHIPVIFNRCELQSTPVLIPAKMF